MNRVTKLRKAVLVISVSVGVIGAFGVQSSFAGTQSHAARSHTASHFSHDTEGWLVSGDPDSPDPTYVAAGGDPGGFIEATDSAQGGIMYWNAPVKFLGDQGQAYGGSLSFDLREQASGRQFDAADVILKGGARRLTYNTAYDPTTDWTHYKVPLGKRGWSEGGQPATRADMLAVLATLHSILIRAEYASHTDIDDLDNVVIKTSKHAS